MKLDDRYMDVIAQMPNLKDVDISNNGGITFQGIEKPDKAAPARTDNHGKYWITES